jgi:DNA mismatch repair protein MutL
MPDIIQILPDALANQIAAGEVIQRPASAVKELLENAIDAGATEVRLIVKEGGKNFIQVSDNGTGMSETDARLAFERHATSKLKTSEDLFNITTKGFRGEALASIAAVAKVIVKTRRAEDNTGTQIEIDASSVVSHEPCACSVGTTFTIKNLFYNVPARRKFLKSDQVEFRHVIDEFQRVALAHSNIAFYLSNDDTQVYQLEASLLRQRISNLMGNNFNNRLVPVEEGTDFVKVHGFVCKPDTAKKTRGEQFFFVNGRFIKNPYFHHAVANAFDDLIEKGSHPGYFLFLEIDPSKIDVNIHPTKTEVKFEDERNIYAVIRASVRQALGKYNITPTLDFDAETAFNITTKKTIHQINQPTIKVNTSYNPFHKEKPVKQEWESFYNLDGKKDPVADLLSNQWVDVETGEVSDHQKKEELDHLLGEIEGKIFQLFNRYLVAGSGESLWIIDQHRAHERVLYEKFLSQQEQGHSQMIMFPETWELSGMDMVAVNEILPDLVKTGFDMEPIGIQSMIIRGVPADATGLDPKNMLETLLEQYKNAGKLNAHDRKEFVARALSGKMSIRSGMVLNKPEILQLIKDLFSTQMPWMGINGKPIIFSKTQEELDEIFLKFK